MEHVSVLDGFTRRHHHTSTDGIQWVGSETCGDGASVSESKGCQKVVLEITDEEDWFGRVVETKVKTTVDDDTNDGWDESTVETGDTIGSEGLSVNVNETVELTLSGTLCGRLCVVGKTGTSVIERVDKDER